MADLPGTEHHPHARATLGAALAPGGRASHAYLFHGPAGSGKRTAARAFAAALLAEGAADVAGARVRVEHGTHPDLTWVTPSGAHEMLVGDVEPVVSGAAMTPFEAARRVFVLERADTLIEQAANKLLKTLEEPAPFVHLLLLTDRLGEVLPTIRSRCQLVRFDALPPAELAERIGRRGIPPEQAAACARLALGDGERALELALGDGPALRAGGEALARAALAGEVAARAPWRGLLEACRARGAAAEAEVLARRDEELKLVPARERRRVETEYEQRRRRAVRRAQTEALDLGLQLSSLWLRDVACVGWGAQDLIHHVDRAAAVAEDAAGRDPRALRAGVELVEETRRRLRSNVTEELALEVLAYRLEGVVTSPAGPRSR